MNQSDLICPSMIYRDFEIEAFEVGRDQWHARFRRLDRGSTVIDGIEFEFLDVGFAWASADAALADARSVIDRMCTQAFASHITGMPAAEARSRDAYIANRMAQTLPTAKASVAAMDNAQAQSVAAVTPACGAPHRGAVEVLLWRDHQQQDERRSHPSAPHGDNDGC